MNNNKLKNAFRLSYLTSLIVSLLSFASCENTLFTDIAGEAPDKDPIVYEGIGVHAGTLEAAFQYIKDNALGGELFYIDLAEFNDDTLYLPQAGDRAFDSVDEMPIADSPTCFIFAVASDVTINLVNTGKTVKTIRLKQSAQGGNEYSSSDLGSLFYIDKKVNFVIDGNIILKGITNSDSEGKTVDGINNNCPLIFMNNGTFTLTGGAVIRDNANILGLGEDQMSTCVGGAVYMLNSAYFTMKNSTITDCSAVAGGGGVYMLGASTLLMESGALIDDNRTTGNYSNCGGGGVRAGTDPQVEEKLVRTIIMEGDAKITNNKVAFVGTSDNDTQNNSSGQRGGGIYLQGTGDYSLIIMRDNAEISGNTAMGSSSQGGGVYMEDKGSCTILLEMYDNAKITGNQANVYTSGSSQGGGVYVTSGNIIMDGDSEISGNTAQGATGSSAMGGGVYLDTCDALPTIGDICKNASLTMRGNSVIKNNQCIAVTESAYPGIGGAVAILGSWYNAGNDMVKLLLEDNAMIPPASPSTANWLNDTTNSVMLVFAQWSSTDPPDPYISVSENWRPSEVIVDFCAHGQVGGKVGDNALDLSELNQQRRRTLGLLDGTWQTEEEAAWQTEIDSRFIEAFTLRYFWNVIGTHGTSMDPDTTELNNWYIDSEGYLAPRDQ